MLRDLITPKTATNRSLAGRHRNSLLRTQQTTPKPHCQPIHHLRQASKMSFSNTSSAPLAKTFLISRAFSLVAMIAVVGITAHFVSQLVDSNIDPPREIVGTLSVVSFSTSLSTRSQAIFTNKSSSPTRPPSPPSTPSSPSPSSTPPHPPPS